MGNVSDSFCGGRGQENIFLIIVILTLTKKINVNMFSATIQEAYNCDSTVVTTIVTDNIGSLHL